jgi:hypothetical protein
MRFFMLLALCLSFTACSKSNSQSLSPNAGGSPSGTPTPNDTQPATATVNDKTLAGDAWSRTEFTDEMDGRKTVIFGLFAKNKIAGSEGNMTPLLSVACADRTDTIVYVQAGSLMTGAVRIKFDDAQPLKEQWVTSKQATAPQPSRRLLNSLIGAKIFKIEVTPRGESPQVATFNLANLNELVNQEKRCKP